MAVSLHLAGKLTVDGGGGVAVGSGAECGGDDVDCGQKWSGLGMHGQNVRNILNELDVIDGLGFLEDGCWCEGDCDLLTVTKGGSVAVIHRCG